MALQNGMSVFEEVLLVSLSSTRDYEHPQDEYST